MARAQAGRSDDPAVAAALAFALKVVEDRGQVGDADVQRLRDAGYGDEQVMEILAHVALNLFTNYTNVAFGVPVDFPAVRSEEHTSELQSLMRISYAVFCLKNNKTPTILHKTNKRKTR